MARTTAKADAHLARQREALEEEAVVGLLVAMQRAFNTVRPFGAMLAAIQRRREERCGQLWLLMRWADAKGSGWLHKDDIMRLWPASPANMRRILREGVQAGYWRRSGGGYSYVGEAGLCAMLGLERVPGWAVEIPVERLQAADIVELRALFYDAYHSSRGDGYCKPIARGGWRHDVGIKRATGRARATQRKYEAVADVDVAPQSEDIGPYSPALYAGLKSEGRPITVLRQPGGARIVASLSNAYRGGFATVRRGRRWVNRRIKHIMRRANSGHVCKPGDSHTSTTKRYFVKPPTKRDDGPQVRRWLWLGWDASGVMGLWRALGGGGYA